MTDVIRPSDANHSHPSEAHRAACPVCHPDKTVPELNEAYRRVKAAEQAHVDLDDAIYGRNG